MHRIGRGKNRKKTMKTNYEDLLIPYSDWLKTMTNKRKTVAEAMLIAEAKHVAEVRNAQGEPLGGWKNKLPLEHSTPTGFFFRALRTGDKSFVRAQSRREGYEFRRLYDTLLNTENVYADTDECKGMSTDQLIGYAESELS